MRAGKSHRYELSHHTYYTPSSLNPTLLQVLDAHSLEVRALYLTINSRMNSFLQNILQTNLSSSSDYTILY